MADGSWNELKYIDGFGSHVSTEALPDALPVGQNSPQVCAYGLYAEQLSGSPFTAPRHKNQRSWLYRIRPSVCHSPFVVAEKQSVQEQFESLVITPNQLRWDPVDLPSADAAEIDFVDGLQLVAGSGDPSMKEGMSIYNYAVNASMKNRAFYNSDGDFLIVPQTGTLYIKTELGRMKVEPCEICVIQRGVKFAVEVTEPSRGYIAELFKGHLELPGLGPIGSNGLANPRDFQTPVAWFEDVDGLDTSVNGGYLIMNKFQNRFFQTPTDHSPFDVVAWHGNYGPYKYDLRKFNCINSVTFDHPDPSIYTVLTCPTDEPGTAVIDFVIFPPRWMVAENTFRPPWFHRNCMSEYMGMIWGKYDAKAADPGLDSKGKTKKGFVAGGASLHSCMTPHGPDAVTFTKASQAPLNPVYFDQGLAFMFETSYLLKVAPSALSDPRLQESYNECWTKMPKLFTGEKKPVIAWEAK